MCVRVHGGVIHYSDNESIWDNMRQFTSPVVISGTERVEDTPAARSHRTVSGATDLLARLVHLGRRVCQRSFLLSTFHKKSD